MKRNMFDCQWFFSDGENGGGAGGSGEGDKERRNLQNLLNKHQGDAMALAATLLGENADLREDKRKLKQNQAPEGAVVLTGEDAKKYQALTELGTPDEIKNRLDALAAYEPLGKPEQIKTRLEHESALNRDTAISAAGYDPERVKYLQGIEAYSFELRDETRDDKSIKVPYAKYMEGDKEVVKPVVDLIAEKYAPLADSLKQAGNDAGTNGQTRQLPKMGVNGGNPANKYEAIRQDVKAKESQNGAPQERNLALAGIH